MTKPVALIMAGGTGGHVFPALAVADVLRARNFDVQWLGSARGIEAEIVPAQGIRLHTIRVDGLRGKGKLRLLLAPFTLFVSLLQALWVFIAVRPKLVIGFGGFASGPGGLIAWLMRTPLVIHEQNALAGTTNSWLAKFSTRTLEAFPTGLPKAERVGNPVRSAIAAVAPPSERFQARTGPLRLLILGGSLGAKFINDLMPAVCAQMPIGSVQVRHQAGVKHVSQCRDQYALLGAANVTVTAFIDDMAEAYSWADLVVCRAGALTVSEIATVGVAALFIPFPFAIDDHQTANAKWLAEAGAAWLMQQNAITPTVITGLIQALTSDRTRLLNMANKARALALPGAAEAVADVCQEVLNG
jgi:UDP-N-acetylglucosamine--N-acetylmuramyl-(pentapeptide) pyrophosphoryl-undecaprenol N-acetylglucosamine transferase